MVAAAAAVVVEEEGQSSLLQVDPYLLDAFLKSRQTKTIKYKLEFFSSFPNQKGKKQACDIIMLSVCVFTHQHVRVYLHAKTDKVHSYITGKVCPATGHECPEAEYRYSSTTSLTWVLHGDEWLMPHPGHFTPTKKTWYPLYRRLCGPQGRSGQVQKIRNPPPHTGDSIPRPSSLQQVTIPTRLFQLTPIHYQIYFNSTSLTMQKQG